MCVVSFLVYKEYIVQYLVIASSLCAVYKKVHRYDLSLKSLKAFVNRGCDWAVPSYPDG